MAMGLAVMARRLALRLTGSALGPDGRSTRLVTRAIRLVVKDLRQAKMSMRLVRISL